MINLETLVYSHFLCQFECLKVAFGQEIQSQGYLCPRCKKSFTPFDVVTLGVSENNLLVCDNCGHELVDNETSAERQANKNQIRKLGEQTKDITDALRKTENVIMPA